MSRYDISRVSIAAACAASALAVASFIWIAAAHGDTDSQPSVTSAEERLKNLVHRTQLLQDEREIENLQRIYSYYLDRALWDQITDLFTDDGTIEIGMRGVYVGKKRIRESLDLFGPQYVDDGRLMDHANLQPVITVAPDGKTAKGRVRALIMNGAYGKSGAIGDGIYENQYAKEGGVWKIKTLKFYTTFGADYDKGWATSAIPAPVASDKIPPDRPPTVTYKNYPTYYVPPFHYPNPVTGKPVQYRPADNQGSAAMNSGNKAAMTGACALALVVGAAWLVSSADSTAQDSTQSTAQRIAALEAGIVAARHQIELVKDRDDVEVLVGAYGYYLDKSLWNQLADLFAADGSIEIGTRGRYIGRERIRKFLHTVYSAAGPKEGVISNHMQLQPVIHVSPDGRTAKARIRLLFQTGRYEKGANWGGGVYENEYVKNNGVWQIKKVKTYTTFVADYVGGWAKSPRQAISPVSKEFPPDELPGPIVESFPNVYDFPFHYANPVTGRITALREDVPFKQESAK